MTSAYLHPRYESVFTVQDFFFRLRYSVKTPVYVNPTKGEVPSDLWQLFWEGNEERSSIAEWDRRPSLKEIEDACFATLGQLVFELGKRIDDDKKEQEDQG